MFKNYDFKQIEESILALWEKNEIYVKSKQKNEGGKPYYFLQGPPYTSGQLHIGHAWNNSLKDMVLRYKRMKGYDVYDRAGYDMHGLPTERKVMALHKMKYKTEIEKFGVAKFSEECLKYSTNNAMQMSKDLQRLGIWMNYDDPYMPVKTEFMEGEWLLVKRAHEQGRLFEGDRTLTWCPSCATAMAKHECDYKTVEDTSVFLKFQIKGKENEYLLIWTTTPWTIMFNLAIMVGPEIEYAKVDVEGEKWVIAKALMNVFIQGLVGKKYTIVEEFYGDKLEGLEYVHPWFDLLPFYKELKREHPNVHTVVMAGEYVSTDSGTGLVHCAPGCGPEDFEVGYRNNIPPFNIIDERGMFPEEAGPFAGRIARKDDKLFIEDFEKMGMLVADSQVEHEYAHCERCGSPVVFRKTKQWFFKVEDLKEKMIEFNKDTYWVPKAGQNAFNSWLENLRDNSISKQRYWGTPVPIWRCDKCEDYDVIGSVAELKAKAKDVPDNIHKPWIDEVKYKCHCGGIMSRVPDILDVWIDAGCASWNSLYYPQRTDLFDKYFPADFILEAKEQVRGWFNLLMVASVIALDRSCFKSVYMHGMITDFEGKKMSKSLGNVISPYEVIDKHGSDTLRYYMCETKPGQDVNFSWEDVKLKYKNLQVLWNVQNYLFDLTRTHKIVPMGVGLVDMDIEEKYIFSKVHRSLKEATELHEGYFLNDITPVIENAFLALSREYIQFIRDKENKVLVANTIHDCLLMIVKMLSPSVPFIAEAIYQNMKEEYGYEDESVHLLSWPEHSEEYLNSELEEEFRVSKEIMTEILAAREKGGIGVRWPLAKAIVHLKNPKIVNETKRLILQQTNIKKIDLKEGDFAVELDTVLSPELEQEGFSRELGRRLQALRKKAGLQKNDRVELIVETKFALEKKHQDELKEKVGANSLHFVHETKETSEFMDEADIKGQKFKFILKK